MLQEPGLGLIKSFAREQAGLQQVDQPHLGCMWTFSKSKSVTIQYKRIDGLGFWQTVAGQFP